MSSPKLQLAAQQKRFESILKRPENRECFDCTAKQPRWASTNLGIFFCLRCAGIHRSLGVHISKVKSTTMDLWDDYMIDCCDRIGNGNGKHLYEAQLPSSFVKPEASADTSAVERIVRQKYEQKRFYAPDYDIVRERMLAPTPAPMASNAFIASPCTAASALPATPTFSVGAASPCTTTEVAGSPEWTAFQASPVSLTPPCVGMGFSMAPHAQATRGSHSKTNTNAATVHNTVDLWGDFASSSPATAPPPSSTSQGKPCFDDLFVASPAAVVAPASSSSGAVGGTATTAASANNLMDFGSAPVSAKTHQHAPSSRNDTEAAAILAQFKLQHNLPSHPSTSTTAQQRQQQQQPIATMAQTGGAPTSTSSNGTAMQQESDYYSDSFDSPAYDTNDEEASPVRPRRSINATGASPAPLDETQQRSARSNASSRSSASSQRSGASPTAAAPGGAMRQGVDIDESASSARFSPMDQETANEGRGANDIYNNERDDGAPTDGVDFNATVVLKGAHSLPPRRKNNPQRAASGGDCGITPTSTMPSVHHHRLTQLQNSNNSVDRSVGRQKPLTKLQRYAVEEGIFAPMHNAIDDVKVNQLVTRLYDPEPLRRRTLRATQNRMLRSEADHYDSLTDNHLTSYWQRKVAFREQIRAEHAQKSMLQQQQRSLLPHMRPATCPPPAAVPDDSFGAGTAPTRHNTTGGQKSATSGHPRGGVHLQKLEQNQQEITSPQRGVSPTFPEDDASTVPSPQGSPSSRRRRDRSLSTVSNGSHDSSGASSCASSPEWKEQRPASPTGVGGGLMGATSGQASQLGASTTAGVVSSQGSTRRSQRTAQIANVRRSDLCAIWMAARPPSPYQRLMSRLSYDPGQAFSLAWLVQGKAPPTGGTLREVPTRPLPVDHQNHQPRLRISSPRSAYVMLRQGVMVNDLTPMTLHQFYLEGSLKGLPKEVVEYHFAARERLRRDLLDEMMAAYDEICASITQEAFVKKLHDVNPEKHREVVLSRERELVCSANRNQRGNNKYKKKISSQSSTLTSADPTTEGTTIDVAASRVDAVLPDNDSAADSGNDVAADGAAARQRIELSMQKQRRRQEKYMQQLERNATLLRDRAQSNKLREEVTEEKHARLIQKRQVEAQERSEEQRRREEKLKQIRNEAKRKELARQEALLDRIKKGEEHAAHLAKKRQQIQLLRHEERKVAEETKVEQVARREKQQDYENLLLIDRIRRKTGRALAQQEMRHAALVELKEKREQNLIEMAERTEAFEVELLAFERKNLR